MTDWTLQSRISTLERGLRNLRRALSGKVIDEDYRRELLERQERWRAELEAASAAEQEAQ